MDDTSTQPMNNLQLAFEIASRITAAISIMINIVRQLYAATLFTLVTTAVFGLGYPVLVTGLAQVLFPHAGERIARGAERTDDRI